MAERDLIELTVRLPAGALEGFSRLASELRDLAQALREGGTPSSAPLRGEQGENAAFDLGRFQALTNRPQPPGRAEAAEPAESESWENPAAGAEARPPETRRTRCRKAGRQKGWSRS